MTLSFLTSDSNAILAAMNKSQAIIEFSLEGKILRANENFCRALGYDLKEIVGQHHCCLSIPQRHRRLPMRNSGETRRRQI